MKGAGKSASIVSPEKDAFFGPANGERRGRGRGSREPGGRGRKEEEGKKKKHGQQRGRARTRHQRGSEGEKADEHDDDDDDDDGYRGILWAVDDKGKAPYDHAAPRDTDGRKVRQFLRSVLPGKAARALAEVVGIGRGGGSGGDDDGEGGGMPMLMGGSVGLTMDTIDNTHTLR